MTLIERFLISLLLFVPFLLTAEALLALPRLAGERSPLTMLRNLLALPLVLCLSVLQLVGALPSIVVASLIWRVAVWRRWAMAPVADAYLWNLLVSLDQAVNTIWLGDPTETISSRAAKAQAGGRLWGCVLCKLLGWIQTDHCQRALLPNAGKAAVVPDGQ